MNRFLDNFCTWYLWTNVLKSLFILPLKTSAELFKLKFIHFVSIPGKQWKVGKIQMISGTFCPSTQAILISEFVLKHWVFEHTIKYIWSLFATKWLFQKSYKKKSYHFVCLKLVPFLKILKTLIYWKKNWCEMKMCQFNKKNAILVSWNTNKVHKFSTKTPLKCIEGNPLKCKKAFSEKNNFQFTGKHNLSESFYENVLTWKKQWILK